MSIAGFDIGSIVNRLSRAGGGTFVYDTKNDTYVQDVDASETAVNVQLPPEAQKTADKLDLTLRIKTTNDKPANININLKDVALLGSLTVQREGSGTGNNVVNSSSVWINGVQVSGGNRTTAGKTTIHCGDVGGAVTSNQGDITCAAVGGYVKTNQGDVHCETVEGDVSTNQGDVTVNGYVGGNCRTNMGTIKYTGNRKRKAVAIEDQDSDAEEEEEKEKPKPKAKRVKK